MGNAGVASLMETAARESSSSSAGSTVGLIIGLLAAAVVVFFGVRTAMVRREADSSAGVLATLDIPGDTTLRLTEDSLLEGYGESPNRHALVGLVGRVEEGGSVNRRFTVTRIAVLGVLAAGLPKRIDDRELYLTIEGPNTVIVHAIPLKKSKELPGNARRFVAKLNQLSASKAPAVAAPTRPTPTPEPAAVTSTDGGLANKLEELSRLRASGLITDEEFASKRAELISRF